MSYKDMVRVQRDIKRKLAEQRVDEERKLLKEAAGPESIREQGAEAVNAKTHNMPGKPAGQKHQGPETAKGTPGTAVKTKTRFMPGQAAKSKNKGPESVPEKKGGSPKVRVRFMPKGTKSASTAGPESVKEKTGDGVSTKTRFRPSLPAGNPKKGPETVKEKPGNKAKLESRSMKEYRASDKEKNVAGEMAKKGYKYFVKLEGENRLQFFKTSDEVGSFLREEFPNSKVEASGPISKLTESRSMKESFMEKEVYEGDAFEIESDYGTQVVPADLVGNLGMTVGETLDKEKGFDQGERLAQVVEELDDYLESGSSAYSITLRHGWLARMQAPGYMDSTDWMIFDTEEEANAELESMYGDDEPEEDEDDIFTEASESEDGEWSMVPCEAYGVRGMDSKRWRRTFKNYKELNDWAEKNDAEVHGTRDLEPGDKGYRESRRLRLTRKVESSRSGKRSLKEGYTHYWRGKGQAFTNEQWTKICGAAEALIDAAEKEGIHIRGGMGEGRPVINKKAIILNGDASVGENHETFRLARNLDGFEFCKTARKPYDSVVVGILRAVKKFAPGVLELSSDGGSEVFMESGRRRRSMKESVPGAEIIQSATVPGEDTEVILWKRAKGYGTHLRRVGDRPDDWYAGHYFDAFGNTTLEDAKRQAEEDYQKRVSRLQWKMGPFTEARRRRRTKKLFESSDTELFDSAVKDCEESDPEMAARFLAMSDELKRKFVNFVRSSAALHPGRSDDQTESTKRLVEAPDKDEEDDEVAVEPDEEADTSTGSDEFEASEEGEFVEPEGGIGEEPDGLPGEEEPTEDGEEQPNIDEQTPDLEAPADSPREWNPGDTALFDYGEGPNQVKIADGTEDRPYRKEGRLWGDEKLPRTLYLVALEIPETGKVEEFYAASFLLK